MLEIRGLRAGYGRIPILHGIDLSVADGETVGILGHNGMGKSTLMKAAMGLVRPTGGSVEFQGEDITQSAPFERARMGLGYVPQGREIFPGITVLENLRMGARTRGGGEAQVVDRVIEELPRLKPLLDRLGGEAQRGRAADPRGGALPVRRAATRASRRADGGHSALDHRPDRGHSAPAGRASRAGVHPGRAEPGLHRRPVRTRVHHPARPNHPRDLAFPAR